MKWKQFQRIKSDVFGLLFAAVIDPDDDGAEPDSGEAASTDEETKNVETKEAAATA